MLSQFFYSFHSKCVCRLWGEAVCGSVLENELENELREIEEPHFFELLKKDDDREKVMEEIDKRRAKCLVLPKFGPAKFYFRTKSGLFLN